MLDQSWTDIAVEHDLAGLPRVLAARRSPSTPRPSPNTE